MNHVGTFGKCSQLRDVQATQTIDRAENLTVVCTTAGGMESLERVQKMFVYRTLPGLESISYRQGLDKHRLFSLEHRG